ncbi:MAG: HlyD family efflux transporter periplasmic adaptor subunit [Planctomycetes bacterium]|nr:HlyD family efflux transporter periplasmic adaptor subunit [Planctomycetota bacterium]
MIWNKGSSVAIGQIAEFEERFPSLRLAKSSRWIRHMAKWLGLLLFAIICFTAFAPWQQFVRGSGRVVAYAPLQRRQVVQAPISGRVARWADGIREGTRVEKGQRIVEIQDLDPNLLLRLQEQVVATKNELEALKQVSYAYEAQIGAFQAVREQTVAAAEEYIMMAQQKLKAENQNLEAVEAALLQVEADYERQKQLADEGLASTFKQQVAQRKRQEALAKVEQAKAYIASAQNGVNAKNNERGAKEREAQAKINSATAQLRKAQGDVAKTEKELVALNVKQTQQQSQVVTAPWNGFIFKFETFQQGAMVKQGDPLFTLVPETTDRAVEIWLDGNDASWVSTGRHVRLQFEGWPGIQLAGWPSIAVNTFGGRVAVVDSTDDGKGQFRILIQPDPTDDPWPSDRFLRQGVRTNGLVMLERVPLWFEIWRQMNGFPPVVEVKQPKKAKKPKIK